MPNDWIKTFDLGELTQLLNELNQQNKLINFSISEDKNNKVLLNAKRIYRHNWRITQNDDPIIKDSLERAGITDYITEFFPSSEDPELTKGSHKIDSMNFKGFTNWLTEITKDKFIVPDTCSLINRILSRRLIPRMQDNFSSKIKISRITILELESLHRTKQHESLFGFCEVRDLTKLGARLMNPLPWNVVFEYSHILKAAEHRKESSGKNSIKPLKPLGDPAIRKEILDYYASISNRDASLLGKGFNISMSVDKPLVITNDMAFAYASFGEDVSSLSFQRNETEKEWVVDEALLSLAIYELAFTYKTIKIDIPGKSVFEFKSYWIDRTFDDLFKNRLMWRELNQ